MGEKGTYTWHALKYAGLHKMGLHGVDVVSGMDSNQAELPDGTNAFWDDEKGQWINSASGEALTSPPGQASR